MRKRTIILAFAAAELVSLPAAAAYYYAGHVPVEKTEVIAAEIASPSGVKRYFVSSDGPFSITADNLTGKTGVFVLPRGHIGDVHFGDKAQRPGAPENCVSLDKASESVIYDADQGTIAEAGEVIEQSVIVVVMHDPEQSPTFEFVPSSVAAEKARGKACPA